VLSHVDIQFISELAFARRWISCFKLFSQVFEMFKLSSRAFCQIFVSMRMLISFRIFPFSFCIYNFVYTAYLTGCSRTQICERMRAKQTMVSTLWVCVFSESVGFNP